MTKLNLKTVNDVTAAATGRGTHVALKTQDGKGGWTNITSDALYGRVRALAARLTAWGVVKGDRVVLLSENRWEWTVTDMATLAIGAADVPLYATSTPEHVIYMLKDSGAKVAVVSSKEQYEKVQGGRGECPELQHVVVMAAGEFEGAESFAKIMEAAPGLEARDTAFDAGLAAVGPDDLATLIYTSGTTGEPKGVMLSHGNFASNVNVAIENFEYKTEDRCVSFLPLSHVTARHVDYGQLTQGVTIAHLPSFNELPAALQAIHPTIFIGVPRVYEKIRQGVEAKSAHSGIGKRVLGWAVKTGRGHCEEVFAGKKPLGPMWHLAEILVFSKIRQAFGGKVRIWISGGAPLGTDTANWFASTGIRVFEGYGLTETSPVIACNYPNACRVGTVGRKMTNLEVRFAADGELEVKGPSVFKGYWKKPKETEEAFTEDGFFKSGDIGEFDAEGFIKITDRKKELLKTSGGKFIAPQPIENKLKSNTLIEQAAVVGDTHKFACVLLAPNFPALEKWAAGQGLSGKDRKELVKEQKVVAEYQRIVDGVNKELAQYETMKRMALVGDEWTIESGELTPSMKLKRRVVVKKYEKEIGEFYKDEATSTRE